MKNISNTSKIIIWLSTIIWAIMMLTISFLMYIDIKISVHYSFEIWLELVKSLLLWHIICCIIALLTDIIQKKIKKM